jgi:hypothetical protein
MNDTHEAKVPPSLWERLARLAGQTTYREPVGGRTTRVGVIPVEHELCVALGWARDRDDPNDIGPDMAIDIATGVGRNMPGIVRQLANALDAGGGRGHRAVRRNRPYLRIVASDAYARLVYGHRYEKPETMSFDDWDTLTDAAVAILERMADNAMSRAERFLRKRA